MENVISKNTTDNSQKQPIKESVKRQKLTLVAAVDPFDDPKPITVESLTALGFIPAPSEDFIGAKETTYFLDVMNENGRTTLVYDFQPLGNQGRPALHKYYNDNNSQISESLVCFHAATTVGELRQLIEAAGHIKPSSSRTLHNIKTVADLITETKKSIPTI